MKNIDLTAAPFPDYELLDSGGNRKLERFAGHLVIRPETQAVWRPHDLSYWKNAEAEFRWSEGKGAWRGKKIPEPWEMKWNDARFLLRLTSFKHTGVFPEQASNWEWMGERIAHLRGRSGGAETRVLNLFGYTGAASVIAALRGAQVTHVDASKQSNAWARENAGRSGAAEGIRYITDDAFKFAEREVRRGASYEGIIVDPPAFGRGAKGEVWRIEEQLLPLLEILKKLITPKPGSFFILNGYAAGYSPRSFAQAAESAFGKIENGEFGELAIAEKDSGRVVPSGIYVRFYN